jgi:hypothetical protein
MGQKIITISVLSWASLLKWHLAGFRTSSKFSVSNKTNIFRVLTDTQFYSYKVLKEVYVIFKETPFLITMKYNLLADQVQGVGHRSGTSELNILSFL